MLPHTCRFTQNCSFIGNQADIGPAIYVGNFSEVTVFDSSIVINNTNYRSSQFERGLDCEIFHTPQCIT